VEPSSGDGGFLKTAGEELRGLGVSQSALDSQVYGIELHGGYVKESSEVLKAAGLGASLIESDFFAVAPPTELFSTLEPFDAIIGNPPYIRYQQHIGKVRKAGAAAALRQGVRLSGLASSWAPLLVHAGAFLKPEGR